MKHLPHRWPPRVRTRRLSPDAAGQIVAVVSVLIAFLVKLGLDVVSDQLDSPFLLFPAAIMISAWYGGWKSGLTSTLLATMLVNWFFLPPQVSLWTIGYASGLRLAVFLMEGAIICFLAEKLHHHRRVAEQQTQEAARAWRTASQHEIEISHVQEQLTSRDVLLRHLVDANVLGVISCRLDGEVVDANAAFLEMIGSSPEELAAGRINWREMTPSTYRPLDEQLIQQLQQTGRFEAAEKEYVLRSGQRLPVWIAGAFTPDREQVLCFVMNRTLQKEAEAALIQAKEAAERSNRTRGEFLANISHELRTPMNAILGMTELALDEELPSHVRDYLETSTGASRTLLYLLDDLLDFSRLEAGKIDLEAAPFSLQNTMDQAIRILGMRAAEKGLELTCSLASGLPDRLIGDQGRLRQIVLNLVGNAIKFTAQGEVNVVLSGEVKPDVPSPNGAETLTLQLVVKDTGIGISASDQERIFEPFTQGDASFTRIYGGTGLGLTIVRQLVQCMGGKVAVSSREGEGATFSVTLTFPVATPDPGAVSQHAGQLHNLRGVRVLVVDDNQTNRKILREIMISWSMQPVVVPDAHTALQEMRQAEREHHEFDVILVDALMPAMDGLQLIQTATSEGLLHGATILMVSSTDRRTLEPQLQSVPVNGLLGKPISQSELLDTLMDSLSGNSPPIPVSNQISRVRNGYRILVAEDAPANQKVVKAILEKRGHVVSFASNGREAIEQLREESFDVVLMDVQMPVLDGWETTRSIRRMPDRSTLPIIAMTAHATRGDREKCLAVGMDDYIAKPLDAHELIRMVERFAGRRIQEGTVFPVPEEPSNSSISPPRPSATEVLDIPAALNRLGGDAGLLRDLANYFLQDVPELLRSIETHRHGDETTRAAHSIRGLAANFGAREVMQQAGIIEDPQSETQSREQAIHELATLLPRMYVELQQRVLHE